MNNDEELRELSLYAPITKWLAEYLKEKYKTARINVFDIHSQDLSDFLERSKYKKHFPEYSTYKIKVDIVGFIELESRCELVFAEVKVHGLNLKDLSQLIGYCRVINPITAFLISPAGIGRPLYSLLNEFGRLDILEFARNKFIRVCRWDEARGSISIAEVIPPFSHTNS